MSVNDVIVIAAVVLAAASLGWWFFGPKPAAEAAEAGGAQEIRVRVRGGYTPSRIHARPGVPVRLVFDRQESGDCTSRVVFPDLGVSADLPAFTETAVELPAQPAGEYGFACGMNMIHGLLTVDGKAGRAGAAPAGDGASSGQAGPALAALGGMGMLHGVIGATGDAPAAAGSGAARHGGPCPARGGGGTGGGGPPAPPGGRGAGGLAADTPPHPDAPRPPAHAHLGRPGGDAELGEQAAEQRVGAVGVDDEPGVDPHRPVLADRHRVGVGVPAEAVLRLVQGHVIGALPVLLALVLGYFMFYGGVREVFVGIVTLSVTLVFETFMAQTAGPEWAIGEARLNGFNGMSGMPPLTIAVGGTDFIFDGPSFFWLLLVLAVCTYLALRILLNSRFGNVLVAIRENPERAEMLGYNVRRYQLAAFAIGGFLAGVLFDADPLDEFFDISTWITAIVGAIALLLVYRMVVGRRGVARSGV